MKFLTFVDLHNDAKSLAALLSRAKRKDIDFIVCAGDISDFGRGLIKVLEKFNALGKKFYVIPGNHEEGEGFERAVKRFPNCINFDRKDLVIEDYVFLGYGTGGFSLQDKDFRKIARKWYGKYKGRKIILVTHQAPYGNKIDKLETGHVGNKDFTRFITRIKPKLAICGHLHETAGLIDNIGPTKLIHPGWEGMVVELN